MDNTMNRKKIKSNREGGNPPEAAAEARTGVIGTVFRSCLFSQIATFQPTTILQRFGLGVILFAELNWPETNMTRGRVKAPRSNASARDLYLQLRNEWITNFL
ncbi:hypothetical protein Y032_1013g3394 [Ancylostoma ceylanicum]|uniref:Uncharacterized protein n=1 Tax=Ancylostoma ceylanicum TaxID=53326 RepID=A0A016W713_9BILA|nr:hypothetical protein Y032_1013g3394 [Ancylostoma ceylanicum]